MAMRLSLNLAGPSALDEISSSVLTNLTQQAGRDNVLDTLDDTKVDGMTS